MRQLVISASLATLAVIAPAAALAGRHAGGPIRLGTSVQGRGIVAYEHGDTRGPKVLVVGCIHGNERAGIQVVDMLNQLTPPHGIDLWLVPDLNPDGVHTHTRGNAHGVDLNRNFPWHWQHLYGRFYSGPSPLSEPESRLAMRLILRLHPRITIWFHQPLNLVDESGGSIAKERLFSRVARLPLLELTRFPGSVASWQNAHFPESSAFVVELPPGNPSEADVRRYARAVLAVAATAQNDGGR